MIFIIIIIIIVVVVVVVVAVIIIIIILILYITMADHDILETDRARFLKKKKMAARIWVKIEPDTRVFFCHFLKFCSSVFLEIAYNDSLQQCLTSSIGKTHKKKFGRSNLGQPKSGRKLGFLSISSVLFISLPLNCRGSEL